MFAMSSHTRVSTDDRLVVKVFHESISVRKLPKTKTKVATVPDDTIVLHRILTSVSRRERKVKVGGRRGRKVEGEEGGRGDEDRKGDKRRRQRRENGRGDRRERERRIRWVSNEERVGYTMGTSQCQ